MSSGAVETKIGEMPVHMVNISDLTTSRFHLSCNL